MLLYIMTVRFILFWFSYCEKWSTCLERINNGSCASHHMALVHFRLLHSSIALSFFNQSLSGHALTQHALQNLSLWTRCQNQPKLPSRTRWILLAEITEVAIILDPQVSHGIDIDEYILAPLFFLFVCLLCI